MIVPHSESSGCFMAMLREHEAALRGDSSMQRACDRP